MLAKKQKTLLILQILHLSAFLTGSIAIILLHIYTRNFLDFLRLPKFLREINALLNYSWPNSLHIYQIILISSLSIAAVDFLGLFFYRSKLWRFVSDLTSFLGFIVILPVILFFIFTLFYLKDLSYLNIQTIITYFSFTLFIFTLDFVTWLFDEKSLLSLKKKKENATIKKR